MMSEWGDGSLAKALPASVGREFGFSEPIQKLGRHGHLYV